MPDVCKHHFPDGSIGAGAGELALIRSPELFSEVVRSGRLNRFNHHDLGSSQAIQKQNDDQEAHNIADVGIEAPVVHFSEQSSHGTRRCANRA